MKQLTLIFTLILIGISISACALSSGFIFGKGVRLSDSSITGSENSDQSEIFINETNGEIPDEAYSLYAANCANCHGKTGQGSTIAPPLNNPVLRTRLEDSELKATILNGRPDTAMPAWRNRLSDPQVNALVSLIRNWEQLDAEKLSDFESQTPFRHGMMGGCCSGMGGHHRRSP